MKDGFLLEYRGEPVDLENRLSRLERALFPKTVVPGRVLAAGGRNPLEKLLLLLLSMRQGWGFLPLDPALPRPRREQLLQLGGAHWLIEDEGFHAREERPLPEHDEGFRLLIATSGTSGEPRLVELNRENLESSARAASDRLGLTQGDSWLVCLPLHHVAAVSAVMRCLLAGARAVLAETFEPQALLQRLSAGDVTHLSLVPTQLQRLVESGGNFAPPASLRVVLLGGAPASTRLVRHAMDQGWPVCPSYGLTEAASQVATVFPPDPDWEVGLAGRVLDHLEVDLSGDGRIRIRGGSVARSIIDEAGRHPLTDASGWFTTADLGRFDEEGRLWILGRADEMLISGGENIHPSTVEAWLAQCPGVAEVAVVGIPDERWGTRLVACYRGEASEKAVEAWARVRLEGVHRPSDFFRVPELPRNGMGKLLRRRLVQELEQR